MNSWPDFDLSIPGWYEPSELNMLRDAAAQQPRGTGGLPISLVEVGVYHGRSAQALVQAAQANKWEQEVWLIDPAESMKEVEERYKELPNVHVCQAPGVQVGIPCFIGLLHIDDDHEYETVRDHLRHFGPQVRRGGIIVLHDYDSKPVARAMAEWLRESQRAHETWKGASCRQQFFRV